MEKKLNRDAMISVTIAHFEKNILRPGLLTDHFCETRRRGCRLLRPDLWSVGACGEYLQHILSRETQSPIEPLLCRSGLFASTRFS